MKRHHLFTPSESFDNLREEQLGPRRLGHGSSYPQFARNEKHRKEKHETFGPLSPTRAKRRVKQLRTRLRVTSCSACHDSLIWQLITYLFRSCLFIGASVETQSGSGYSLQAFLFS